MDDLPLELIVHILQYLNKTEQLKVSTVSKKFYEAVLSPSLWTENEESLEVLPNRIKSFRKFLKQLPWLRYLNVEFKEISLENQHLIDINLRSLLKPLKKLECLLLELNNWKPSESYFPSTLKHISLCDCSDQDASFINDDLLKSLADSCPLLEYIEIFSLSDNSFSHQCLQYLLEKVKDTLQILILSNNFKGDHIFGLIDCPPNVKIFQTLGDIRIFGKLIDLPNLEILQILALDHEFPLNNEDFKEKLSIPSLQILYLNNCYAEFDVVLKFVKSCPSLKVLAWYEHNGYSNKALSELEKLSKQNSVKIYLNFTADPIYCDEPMLNFPLFPNENFLCFESFNDAFLNKHHFITNFFKCGIVPY